MPAPGQVIVPLTKRPFPVRPFTRACPLRRAAFKYKGAPSPRETKEDAGDETRLPFPGLSQELLLRSGAHPQSLLALARPSDAPSSERGRSSRPSSKQTRREAPESKSAGKGQRAAVTGDGPTPPESTDFSKRGN